LYPRFPKSFHLALVILTTSLGHAQLLVDAAESGSGHKRTLIPEEEAKFSYQQVGTPEKGWLAFQPYYDQILATSGGSFLK
jgi:hypothetical protein